MTHWYPLVSNYNRNPNDNSNPKPNGNTKNKKSNIIRKTRPAKTPEPKETVKRNDNKRTPDFLPFPQETGGLCTFCG